MPSGGLQTIRNDVASYIGAVRPGGRVIISVATAGATCFLGFSRADLALIGGNNQGIPVQASEGTCNFDWEGDLWAIADAAHASIAANIALL